MALPWGMIGQTYSLALGIIMPQETSPFGEVHPVIVDRMRFGLEQRVSRYVAEALRMGTEAEAAACADVVVMRMVTELLTERLPPHTISHRISYEHPEAIGRPGNAVDARFARPIDHFTAKYRGRWWARLLRMHKRKIEYIFIKVPYLISTPVQCHHTATTNVRAAWTYPTASMVLPGGDFGHPVLRADLLDTAVRPWIPDDFGPIR